MKQQRQKQRWGKKTALCWEEIKQIGIAPILEILN